MDRKTAKELLHIQGWIQRVDEIVRRGKTAYLADNQPGNHLENPVNRPSSVGASLGPLFADADTALTDEEDEASRPKYT